ncbi:MAG: DUF423 domain-containing protein [Campylobacterota bacterium]|nr:DUF423 domain-containing protein [Campylobacterota bacterium]
MGISKDSKNFLIIASLMMAAGIAIGAFGAHGLQPYLDEYGNIIYNKGVSYWFYNTAGLFGVAFMSHLLPDSTKIKKGFYFILGGTLIFSISLYILALTHIKWLGAVTPIGGTSMIIGWVLCVIALCKDTKDIKDF